MKTNLFVLGTGAAIALMMGAGCVTKTPPGVEAGPHRTIAYDVLVEASEPGARIEVNGNVVGNTPLHLKLFGNKNGTFHDFGSYYFNIRAYPVATNQFEQIKVFQTGRDGSPQDLIPRHLYFDMNQAVQVVVPAEPRRYNYAPAPYPYYYGPSFQFYVGPGPGYYHHWR